MRNLFRIFIKSAAISLCIGAIPVNGQILSDTASLNLIKNGVDSIYNMQFAYADKVYNKISRQYPDHPLVLLFKGIETYWENYPMLPSSSKYPFFEDVLRKCVGISEKNSNSVNEAEYLLANLSARGSLIQFYANNGLENEVIPIATTTYRFIKRSFDFTSVYSDFYCFTGLFNYYREVYPEAHPAYKPLTFLLRKGNRIKGLEAVSYTHLTLPTNREV